MSGTRSTSRKAPATDGPDRPDRKSRLIRLALLFSPFVWAAVAINLFMAGLISASAGWASLSPVASMVWAVPLAIPASWWAARWIAGLMDQAKD